MNLTPPVSTSLSSHYVKARSLDGAVVHKTLFVGNDGALGSADNSEAKMILAWLALFDGILAASLAIAGILFAHFGLVPPFHLRPSPAFFGFLIVSLGFFMAVIGI